MSVRDSPFLVSGKPVEEESEGKGLLVAERAHDRGAAGELAATIELDVALGTQTGNGEIAVFLVGMPTGCGEAGAGGGLA
jgi:hypothetical protein